MSSGPHRALALTARVSFLESLLKGSTDLVDACVNGAKVLATQTAEPAIYQRRRDLVLDFPNMQAGWQQALELRLREALGALRFGRPIEARTVTEKRDQADGGLALLDDSSVERDLVAARLGQTVGDLTGSEFIDLSARLQAIHGLVDAQSNEVDALNTAWLGHVVVDAWLQAGLTPTQWATLRSVMNHEVAQWVREGYHTANRVLREYGVRPEINLRPFIRRTPDAAVVGGRTSPSQFGDLGGPFVADGGVSSGAWRSGSSTSVTESGAGLGGGAGRSGKGSHGGVQPVGAPYEETHLLTQIPDLTRSTGQAQALLGKLNQMVARQVPAFSSATSAEGGAARPAQALSTALGQAINLADQSMRRLMGTAAQADGSPSALLQDIQQNKQALKQAANGPVELATIEIVALLFQHILTEERLPSGVRVWFARLQMPVLRVAVSEPDFFATINHPARMLIDRMGSCVMGFAGDGNQDEGTLNKEIKRIVQVVEAYPDTGRRVFQTVLVEFEKFLETYFREQNEATRKGVSLAQQVEQRETLAIQYTIELRKMLEGVPVHDGVRDFMFRVWADVLAHSAVQGGAHSDETRMLQRAAADLIWSASAKTSREDRADVLRRLPPLLKIMREGMARLGLSVSKQDEYVSELNTALAAAFSARSSAISSTHLQEVADRLESLGDILPDLSTIDLDEQTLRDLSGHESDDLEVVADGGSMPTPAMVAWARELQSGAWFQLDYRNRQESVQLAWHGLQKQLALFVTPSGRGVLFQARRLAAFLQAGLLVPVEDESLTTRATREALLKLNADPQRLLS